MQCLRIVNEVCLFNDRMRETEIEFGFASAIAPNTKAHREPPRRALSASPKPQRGGDAVERDVRRRSCPSG
jgi:hypothetical protein